MDSPTLAAHIADSVADLKGLDIVTIDVRGRASYTDFLVVASGTSDRHVQAVAENVELSLALAGERSLGREGLREGQWALIDYGSVVLHVFHTFCRSVYDLERLWQQAPQSRQVTEQVPGSTDEGDPVHDWLAPQSL